PFRLLAQGARSGFLSGIPYLDRPVRPCRRYPAARSDRHAPHGTGVTMERTHTGTSSYVPHFDGLVVAAGDDVPAVRGKRRARHAVAVPAQGESLPPSGGVPDLDAVPTGRDDSAAVGAEADAEDMAGPVVSQEGGNHDPCGRIPHQCRGIARSGGDAPAIG